MPRTIRQRFFTRLSDKLTRHADHMAGCSIQLRMDGWMDGVEFNAPLDTV